MHRCNSTLNTPSSIANQTVSLALGMRFSLKLSSAILTCKPCSSVTDLSTLETNNPSMDLSLCLVCQLQTDEELVENPSSYEHLVHSISLRASYREAKYVEIWANLKEYNSQELNLKGATWHRKCYQAATHSEMIKRSKERLVLK